ncbi:MAG: hypothetical protein NT025_05430 [bacterium]|nr:hypothetical protein [bacterium]
MRLLWSLLVLAFAARAMAKGLPLYISGGGGCREPGTGGSALFVTSIALMTPDIDRGGTRVECCVGAWYLRQKYQARDDFVKFGWAGDDDRVVESQALYQAVKFSGRTRTQPGHFPLFEVGLGLGVHEEWQRGEPLDYVPRLHVSTRFCLLPSRSTSPFMEMEWMPQLSEKGGRGVGQLFWGKLGYAFRV